MSSTATTYTSGANVRGSARDETPESSPDHPKRAQSGSFSTQKLLSSRGELPGSSSTQPLPTSTTPLPFPPPPTSLPKLPFSGQLYHDQISKLKHGGESMLRRLGAIPNDWGIMIPGPGHRAHLPPTEHCYIDHKPQFCIRGWRVYLQDEHGTSTEAVDHMIAQGLSKSARQGNIDAYAAVKVLERYFSDSGYGIELLVPKQVELQNKLRKGPRKDVDFFPEE